MISQGVLRIAPRPTVEILNRTNRNFALMHFEYAGDKVLITPIEKLRWSFRLAPRKFTAEATKLRFESETLKGALP
jgi:hypothetical protein